MNTRLRCPLCRQQYMDLMEHFKKKHPLDQFTSAQLAGVGLIACHNCGKPIASNHGLKTHIAKSQCGPLPDGQLFSSRRQQTPSQAATTRPYLSPPRERDTITVSSRPTTPSIDI